MAKSTRKKPRARKTAKSQSSTADPSPRLEVAQPFKWRDRGDWLPLGVVLAVAFVLRMVFFILNMKNNPVFFHPIMDALYHHEWATDILRGSAAADDVYFRGPFYPYFVAFLYKLSGSSIAFVVFVQHLIGTASAGLVYFLSREYFSRRVSFVAGLIAALYWPFVYFEGDLLIVTVFVFWNILALLLMAKSLRRDNLLLLVAAGLCFGLSAIARPSVLIVFPALPLVLYLNRRLPKKTGAGWIGRTAVLFAGILVVIMPVMIRNFVVARSIVPIAASGGVNFFIGNNPRSDGSTAIVPDTRADWWGGYYDAIAIAERDEGRKLKLAEVSSYFFRRGLEWFRDSPGDAFSHLLKKLRVFWAGPERANNKFIYFFWNLAGMKYVPLPGYWLVAPLALLGGILQWRRRRLLSPLYFFILLYMVGVVAFFVNARFRLPVTPFLIIFAAYAVVYLVEVFRSKDFRLVPAMAILAAAALLVNVDYLKFHEIRAYSTAFSHSTLGNAYMKMNLKETALEHYVRAREIHESAPTQAYDLIARDVDYNMGTLLWERGLCSRAIPALRRVGGTDVYAQNALDHLGDCYLRGNDVAKAQAAYQELARISPDDVRVATGLARCYAAAGNLEQAESMLRAIVEPATTVHVPAYLALADVQRRLGKTEEAIKSYTDISRFMGYERDALVALAELYQETGNIDAALQTLEKATFYFPPNDPTLRNWIAQLRSRR